ncbi:hypothetical protein HY643_04020 [Candidatus Woesearchaeota archaeon]|nr:hypothetical protein [Candidatus Woesearchaeota archaeon]
MLEKLKKAFKKLTASSEFKDFEKNHPEAYFSSAFFITEYENRDNPDWQIDFFHPTNGKLTNFAFTADKIEVSAEQQPFQKEEAVIEKLDLKEAAKSDGALGDIEDFRKNKYPNETPNKIIVILQKIKGQVIWNVTYLTTSLKIINVKADAEDGKIFEDSLESILSLKPKSAL